ncbi:MAG: translocation/assembly module TamB domain-containing protein, partial [Prolixibacteraceae bacterium]
MAKWIKYTLLPLGLTLAVIALIIILAGLLIQTRPVKNKLALFIEQHAPDYIDGQLSIGEIEGNFFSHIKLNDVLLTCQGDTVSRIANLSLHYDLWPLTKGRLQIHTARVNRPRLQFKQLNDSTWNVQQIMKPAPKKAGGDSSGNFMLSLAALQITEGSVSIESPDTLLPRNIDKINTRLSAFLTGDKQQVTIDSFSMSASRPDLELRQLTFRFRRNTNRIELSDLKIRTARNQLSGSVAYAREKSGKSSADLESDPIRIQEFSFFLPKLTLPATPLLKIDAVMEDEILHAVVDLKDQEQHIHLDLKSKNFATFLYNPGKTILEYRLTGDLKKVDLAHWLGKPDLKYLINGQLSAEGTGVDTKTATARLTGRFTESRLADYPLDMLEVNLLFDQGTLNGTAQGYGDFGAFQVRPKITGLNSEPAYFVDITTRKLDLAALTGVDSLKSNINMQVKASGKGFDPRSAVAKAVFNMSRSQFKQIHIDTVFANAQYGDENITIDSLRLETGDLTLFASGNYSLHATSDVRLAANFKSLDEFGSFLPIDSIQTSGSIEGRLTGEKDSLNLAATLKLNESNYGDFSFGDLQLNTRTVLTVADTLLTANLQVNNLSNQSFGLDSVSARMEGSLDSVFVAANFHGKDLTSQIQSGILPGEKLRFLITRWLINYKNERWALVRSPATIEIDSANYRISDFKIASGKADSSQYIMANGTVSRTGNEDFQMELANINLARLMDLFQIGTNASGLANLNLSLTGAAASPLLKADLGFRRAVFNDYPIRKLEGTVNYKDSRLNVESQIIPRDSGQIDLTGTIPLHLRLDSMTFNFDPQGSVNALVTVRQFPLAVLNAFVMADEINGLINGKISLDGPGESPNPKGNLAMKNGSFKMREYGIDYRDIDFNIGFSPQKIELDTFLIETDDGRMTATGRIDFNSSFYSGDVSQSEIKVNFNKFNPFDHDQFNMQLSGNAGLSGEKGKVVFDGSLNVPRSEIFLPAVLSLMGRMNTAELPEPILIREMKKMSEQPDTIRPTRTEVSKDTAGPAYFENLTGKIRLKIPRNTWIKSDDMHIELSGDLELIKNKEFFELFGTADIVRGQYDLFGKTFVINEGIIRFQGGEEITPVLDITA